MSLASSNALQTRWISMMLERLIITSREAHAAEAVVVWLQKSRELQAEIN
jgi:hypothetical protein